MRIRRIALSLTAPLLAVFSLSARSWATPDSSPIEPPEVATETTPTSPVDQTVNGVPGAAAVTNTQPGEEAKETRENGSESKGEPKSGPTKENAGQATREDPCESPSSESAAPYRGPGTLLSKSGEKIAVGGYGGVTVLATDLEGQTAMLIGGEGAVLLDHRLVIGLGGYGLTSVVDAAPFENGDRSLLMLGYGGPIMRYQFVGEGPLVLSIGALIGGGGFGFLREISSQDWEVEEEYTTGQVFFVIEPSLQAHVHLTRWMRLGANLNYRAIQGANARGVDDQGLSSFSGGGHLQFGWF
jgi:hypothetical protein